VAESIGHHPEIDLGRGPRQGFRYLRNPPEIDPVAIRPYESRHTPDAGVNDKPSVGYRHVCTAFLRLDAPGPHAARSEPPPFELVEKIALDHGVTWFETNSGGDTAVIRLVAGYPRSNGREESSMIETIGVIHHHLTMPVSAGVAAGRVFVAEVGMLGAPFTVVVGDSVNVAARLGSAAAWGEILATGQVVKRARLAGVPRTLQVRNRRGPVDVVSLRSDAAKDAQEFQRVPFVGRFDIVSRLNDIERRPAERPAVVEVTGPPGIGKTRAVQEWLSHGRRPAWTIRPFGEANQPYSAVRRAIQTWLGSEGDNRGARTEIARQIEAHCHGAEQSIVRQLFGLPNAGTTSPTAASAVDLNHALRHGLAHLIIGVGGPDALLFVDDFPMLDDASIRVLTATCRTAPPGWTVITTCRDGGRPPSEYLEMVTSIEMPPLTESESAKLFRLAGGGPDASVATQANGNPLFIEALAEATRSGQQVFAPEVDSIIGGSVDQIAAVDLAVLQCASVLGNESTVETLANLLAVTSPDPPPVGSIANLATLDDSGQRLAFAHALVRDVVSARMPVPLRRELHSSAANLLLKKADPLDPVALAEVSHHLMAARRFEEAWALAESAANVAMKSSLPEVARSSLALAAQAIDACPGAQPEDRVRILASFGELLESLCEYDIAFRSTRASIHHQPDPIARATAMCRLAIIQRHRGRLRSSSWWLTRARHELDPLASTAETSGSEGAISARHAIDEQRAALFHRQGRYDACRILCTRLLDDVGLSDRQIGHLMYLYDAALIDEDPSAEVRYGETALRHYEAAQDTGGQVLAWNNLGVNAYYAADFERARTCYERARALATEVGDTVSKSTADLNLAELDWEEGRHAAATLQLREARAAFERHDYLVGQALATAHLGRIALELGNTSEARSMLIDALDLYQRIGNQHFIDDVVIDLAALDRSSKPTTQPRATA
jgi:tetratricopeptide (TPR) repeat protein